MNRHERRKAAVEARKAKRQKTTRVVAIPLDAAAKERFKNPPPGYTKLIERMCPLLCEWQQAHPDARPEWHEGGEVLVTGSLASDAVDYLAKNEDALDCLHWLDEKTGGEGTVFQARVALGCVGAFRKPEVLQKSGGQRIIEAFIDKMVNAKGGGHVGYEYPCPHCGKALDTHAGEGGEAPTPGKAISLCCYCAGLTHFDEDGVWRKISDEKFATAPEGLREAIAEAQDTIRQTNARIAFGQKPHGRVDA